MWIRLKTILDTEFLVNSDDVADFCEKWSDDHGDIVSITMKSKGGVISNIPTKTPINDIFEQLRGRD